MAETRRGLLAGEAVAGPALARRLELEVGDVVNVGTNERAHGMRIAGLAGEYTSDGDVLFVDRQTAQRLFGIYDTHVVMIQADERQSAQVGRELRKLADREHLILQSFADFRQLIASMLAGISGGLRLLLVLGLMIAALGVVNTLMMNVLERPDCSPRSA
jgi:ABC-type lipoprotein release transport system permease subunit